MTSLAPVITGAPAVETTCIFTRPDGTCSAAVVLKYRTYGALIAVPEGMFSADTLDAADAAGFSGEIGPWFRVS